MSIASSRTRNLPACHAGSRGVRLADDVPVGRLRGTSQGVRAGSPYDPRRPGAVLVGGHWERDRAGRQHALSGNDISTLPSQFAGQLKRWKAERGLSFIERDDEHREVFVRISVRQAARLTDRDMAIGDRVRLLRGSVAMMPIPAVASPAMVCNEATTTEELTSNGK